MFLAAAVDIATRYSFIQWKRHGWHPRHHYENRSVLDIIWQSHPRTLWVLQ